MMMKGKKKGGGGGGGGAIYQEAAVIHFKTAKSKAAPSYDEYSGMGGMKMKMKMKAPPRRKMMGGGGGGEEEPATLAPPRARQANAAGSAVRNASANKLKAKKAVAPAPTRSTRAAGAAKMPPAQATV